MLSLLDWRQPEKIDSHLIRAFERRPLGQEEEIRLFVPAYKELFPAERKILSILKNKFEVIELNVLKTDSSEGSQSFLEDIIYVDYLGPRGEIYKN